MENTNGVEILKNKTIVVHIPQNRKDFNSYCGTLLETDFSTVKADNINKYDYKGSYIAQRILSDLKFDKECKRKSEFRDATKRE